MKRNWETSNSLRFVADEIFSKLFIGLPKVEESMEIISISRLSIEFSICKNFNSFPVFLC